MELKIDIINQFINFIATFIVFLSKFKFLSVLAKMLYFWPDRIDMYETISRLNRLYLHLPRLGFLSRNCVQLQTKFYQFKTCVVHPYF